MTSKNASNKTSGKQVNPSPSEPSRDMISLDVGVEVEAFIDRMTELTGYTVEELFTQIICANFPEYASSLLDHSYFESSTRIPFWFHLGSSNYHTVAKIAKQYENRISFDHIIDKIIELGWNDLNKVRLSDH